MTALQQQVLKDNLQVMDGGYIALRGGRYVVCPRRSNQHTIPTPAVFQAIEAGFAILNNRHVRLTEQGKAFCEQ